MKKEDVLLMIFGVLLLFSIIMLALQYSRLTGYNIAEGTTTSNVTISAYLAMSMSTNLSTGIMFGSIDVLGVNNYNATHNNDSTGGTTSMFINVSSDSNTAIDFCIKANDHLKTSGADVLGLGNESYANSTSVSASLPALTNEVSLTTSYALAGKNVAIGGTNFYRFWLDAPLAQPTGSYNNTVSFKGVATGVSC